MHYDSLNCYIITVKPLNFFFLLHIFNDLMPKKKKNRQEINIICQFATISKVYVLISLIWQKKIKKLRGILLQQYKSSRNLSAFYPLTI